MSVHGLIYVAVKTWWLTVLCALLMGCMTLSIEAREGSTVTVRDSGNKTVTIETARDATATLPVGALAGGL